MQVPIEQGRAELTANRFRRDDRQDDSDGEWWVPEAGHPSLLLQYVGQNKDCFDRDQLDHVLDWGLYSHGALPPAGKRKEEAGPG